MTNEQVEPAILVENISKSFGNIKALDNVNLLVYPGTVLALLGPNGAGKTTLIRILTTLLLPDKGAAKVGSYDVVKGAEKLRSIIGLTGQYAAVDENLTGAENLELVGRLYHLGKSTARKRTQELLEGFGLTEAANRQVKTYSGGMRRRLDLAASLIGEPQVLFLDEPTAGLDPASRFGLWAVIKKLAKAGTTILLTTQYMEEAEKLADEVVVIDRGEIVASGTVVQLKSKVGGEVLEVSISDPALLKIAANSLENLAVVKPQVNTETAQITLPLAGRAQVLAQAINILDQLGVDISNITLRKPTLDDVFLTLTGHKTAETEQPLSEPEKNPEQVLWKRE